MEDDLHASLMHASACQVADGCDDAHCQAIKRKLAHYKEVPMDHCCSDCMDVVDMCMRHVLDCPRGPECSYVAGMSMECPRYFNFIAVIVHKPYFYSHYFHLCAWSVGFMCFVMRSPRVVQLYKSY